MFRRILVPVDLTIDCARALPVAAAMAHRAHAEVVALLVTPELRDPALDRYEARDFLDAHGGERVPLWLDPFDDVATTIAAHAREDSTLVCMATHGRSTLGELAVGSVAAAVERQRTGPVMLVGPEVIGWQGPRSLQVCCDESNAAAALVPVAREWCEAMNLRPEVVHVQPRGERPGTRAASDIAAALDTTVSLRIGSVAAWTIAELAAQRPGAVVMVATTTTGRLSKLLRGSTTRALVAKSIVPVVAVPARDENQTEH